MLHRGDILLTFYTARTYVIDMKVSRSVSALERIPTISLLAYWLLNRKLYVVEGVSIKC